MRSEIILYHKELVTVAEHQIDKALRIYEPDLSRATRTLHGRHLETNTIVSTPGSSAVIGLAITSGKTFTVTHTITLAAGSDGVTLTIPATGTAALGTGAANRVAYWSGTNTLTSSANLTYNGSTFTIGGTIAASLLVVNGSTTVTNAINLSPTSTNTGVANFRSVTFGPTMSSDTTQAGALAYGPRLTPTADLSAGTFYGVINLATMYDTASNTNPLGTLFANFYRIDTNANYTGTMTTASCINIASPSLSGAVPVTVNGLVVQNQGNASGTNAAGIVIANQASATNRTNLLIGTTTIPSGTYSIYNSATSDNHFAGNIGVGTTAPVSLLDVSAATGGIITLSRNDTTASSADMIGKIQFWNNDTQLTTQNIFAEIEVQAAQAITTDAAAGRIIIRTTGTTVGGSPVEAMRITETQAVTFASATGGFGYGTGAGGTVTQATSKSTGVTLSKVTGQITMHNAALAGDTTVSFVLTNTTIAATDLILLNHISGGTAGSYLLNAQAAAGSATINVRNITTGSLSEAIVIAFAVVRSVTA